MLIKDPDFALEGYVYDDELRIWRRPAFERFAYSDGDAVEQGLATLLHEVVDLSVCSPELAANCTDWPRRYHLSAARANLLRPLSHRIDGDVLEIGSGCGAITRFLGECGANVLALEGSQRRATITALRTRDLPNVTVLNDRFDGFKTNRKFDVVTLIGVLEYAALFSAASDPVEAMLRSVRSLLRSDGLLIVAIENQLGLKYFAGAPEDHVGIPMYGIQSLYDGSGVETFGRRDLHHRLQDAGFPSVELALPFPDYKLPVAVVPPRGWSKSSLMDADMIASQTVMCDAQVSSMVLNFALERVWHTIGRNGLLADLANSFLFVASPTPSVESVFKEGELAHCYAVDRAPEFCTATTFQVADQGILVRRQSLFGSHESSDKAYSHEIEDESFVQGTTMEENFQRVLLTPGWTIRQVAEVAAQYVDVLLANAGDATGRPATRSLDCMLPGQVLDLMPRNIIVAKDGGAHVVGPEWTSRGPLPLGYLIFRALESVLRMTSSCALPDDRRFLIRGVFFTETAEHMGFGMTQSHFEDYLRREASLASFTLGRDAPIEDGEKWAAGRLQSELDVQPGAVRVLRDELDVRSRRITSIERELAVTNARAEAMRRELDTVLHSTTWRATSPLRALARRVKRAFN